jgi:hemerythrin
MHPHQHPILESSAIPLVALESMNATHREEVALINRLAALLDEEQRDEDDISQQLEDWVAHTRAHFERENQLMRDSGFPAYPIHSDEHHKVLAQIEGLRQQWLQQRDPGPLADFLFEQWPRWFLQHVTSMDRVTAQFVVLRQGQRVPARAESA